MKRTWWLKGMLLVCVMIMPNPALAQDEEGFAPAVGSAQASGDISASIPADAWGIICARNVGELDRKLLALFQQLNTPPMSPLAMAKGTLGLMSGVDDNGSVAIVLMPTANPMDPSSGMLIVIPCTDFAALTSMLTPTDAGEGITKIAIQGSDGYAAQMGSFALLAPSPDAIKSIMATKDAKKLRESWSAHQLKRFETDDLTLWLNLQAILDNPAIDQMLQGLMMMGGGGASMEDIKSFAGFALAVRLNNAGAGLGFYFEMKEGSEQAKATAATKTTKESLLTGLPKEKFVAAFGSQTSKEAAAYGAESLSKTLSSPGVAMMFNPEKMSKLSGILADMVRDLRALAFSITALPEGPDGTIGLTKVVTMESGASSRCGQIGEIIGLLTEGLFHGEEAQKVTGLVKYTSGAETIGGVSVDHLTFGLDQVPDITPEDVEKFKRVLGKDGVLFRIAAVDDKRIAVAFGGGSERMQQVMETVKSGGAPLSADESIKKVAATLPSERATEIYLAIDTMMTVANAVGTVAGEPLPFKFPEINSPLGVVGGPVGANGYQADLALPMELIIAAKDVFASMAGGGYGPGSGPDGDANGDEGGSGGGNSD